MLQNQKVSLVEKVGYGLGDCSANLVFQMMMIYQTKFYTDVFGLEGAIAGTVMLVARIVDAFVDPTVGILSDRTNSRWGKYRPWVLWTALPFMVFYVLAFYNPGIEDKGLVALYATISYTLLMTMYSFNNTPYSSLGGVMSADIKERTSITSVRFVFSTIGQFVVQGLTLPLVNKFSAGDDLAHGWLCTISLFAAVGLVFLVVVFFSAKERITPPAGQKTNIREDVKTRLMWGLTYQLRYLSADEAGEEFLRLARERGIEFDSAQRRWIEARCPRDMRGLRRFLDAVDEKAVREHRRITTVLLDATLKDVLSKN